MRGARAGAAAVAFLLLTGARGGGSARPLTKAEFIRRADAICTAYQARVDKVTAAVKPSMPRDRVVTIVRERMVPIFLARAEELSRLRPPRADRDTVSNFLDDDRLAGAHILKGAAAFVANRGRDEALERADKAMREYGLQVCGALPGP